MRIVGILKALHSALKIFFTQLGAAEALECIFEVGVLRRNLRPQVIGLAEIPLVLLLDGFQHKIPVTGWIKELDPTKPRV